MAAAHDKLNFMQKLSFFSDPDGPLPNLPKRTITSPPFKVANVFAIRGDIYGPFVCIIIWSFVFLAGPLRSQPVRNILVYPCVLHFAMAYPAKMRFSLAVPLSFVSFSSALLLFFGQHFFSSIVQAPLVRR